MSIKAALLDAPAASGKGVYLRIDELADEAALTDRHVPKIEACDLPAGQYVWIPDATPDPENPYGGQFVAIEFLERRNRPDFNRAFADLCTVLGSHGIKVPASVHSWNEYAARRGKRRAPNKGGA